MVSFFRPIPTTVTSFVVFAHYVEGVGSPLEPKLLGLPKGVYNSSVMACGSFPPTVSHPWACLVDPGSVVAGVLGASCLLGYCARVHSVLHINALEAFL